MVSWLTFLVDRPTKMDTILKNRYKIMRYIGRGSYGQVYLAFDQQSGNTVVVKKHRERKGKNSKEMLKKEAQTLASLNHPSIPKYIDSFQEEKKWFLVMDYISGSNFEDLVLNAGQSYNEKESLQIFLQVLLVIKYLHENQIIHRDLRLPNIIKNDSQIYIIDFGLAVYNELEEAALSPPSRSEKTLFKERSYKSDFYALGHILLFLLYSSFQPTSKKEQSWEDELTVKIDTKNIIRKLLRSEGVYEHIDDILYDVEAILNKF